MMLSRLPFLLFAATLLGTSLANGDATQLLTKIPKCAQICSLKTLAEAKCPLVDLTGMANCLCSNGDLQKKLATCVIGSCNAEEQFISASVLQEDVCKGTPKLSRSNEIITVSIVMAAITYPIIALRFISRWVVANKFWWDDACVGFATIFMITLTVIPILNAHAGFGMHFWDVSPKYITPLRQMYYASQIIYVFVLILSKMTVLFLYLRIFITPGFRRLVKWIIAIVVLHGVIFVFCVAFQCIPVDSIWTQEGRKCLDTQALVYTGAAFNIFEDFMVMFLPVFELRGLNLSTKRRVALVFMFALGSFASITSCIRLKYIVSFGNSIDVTWDNVDVVIWSEIEAFTAVICACIVCIRPLFAKLTPTIFRSKHVLESNSKTPHRSSVSATNARRWSQLVQNKIQKNGIQSLSGEDTLVESPYEDAGKVWVTQEAKVETRSIALGEIPSPGATDELTAKFKGKTIIEANPNWPMTDPHGHYMHSPEP